MFEELKEGRLAREGRGEIGKIEEEQERGVGGGRRRKEQRKGRKGRSGEKEKDEGGDEGEDEERRQSHLKGRMGRLESSPSDFHFKKGHLLQRWAPQVLKPPQLPLYHLRSYPRMHACSRPLTPCGWD